MVFARVSDDVARDGISCLPRRLDITSLATLDWKSIENIRNLLGAATVASITSF